MITEEKVAYVVLSKDVSYTEAVEVFAEEEDAETRVEELNDENDGYTYYYTECPMR